MAKTDFKTVSEYIATFSKEDQVALEQIRKTIQKAAPQAEEVISYQIPAYKDGKSYVIYFSGFKEHYSLAFPPPFTVFETFAKELAPYKQSKSVVQLPKSSPLPLDLIARMVKFRLEEANAKPQGVKATRSSSNKAATGAKNTKTSAKAAPEPKAVRAKSSGTKK